MKNLREKSRRISGKINAFRKIISERHLIWNAVLVNFRSLCNCYIIPNVSKTDRTLLDGKRIFNRFVALITRDLEIIHGDPGF